MVSLGYAKRAAVFRRRTCVSDAKRVFYAACWSRFVGQAAHLISAPCHRSNHAT